MYGTNVNGAAQGKLRIHTACDILHVHDVPHTFTVNGLIPARSCADLRGGVGVRGVESWS